uniref:Uncharacterized protein n=1 Tax=Rhabditophanes sp. KR3021 TaxID=114890 RepID=A0AC35U141_9BILA
MDLHEFVVDDFENNVKDVGGFGGDVDLEFDDAVEGDEDLGLDNEVKVDEDGLKNIEEDELDVEDVDGDGIDDEGFLSGFVTISVYNVLYFFLSSSSLKILYP